jgi:membrane protease YdiL (CAAX protease family)
LRFLKGVELNNAQFFNLKKSSNALASSNKKEFAELKVLYQPPREVVASLAIIKTGHCQIESELLHMKSQEMSNVRLNLLNPLRLSVIVFALYVIKITTVNWASNKRCIPILQDYTQISTDMAATLIGSLLVAPILEEYVFRRVIFNAVHPKLGTNAFLIISTITFVAAHYQNYFFVIDHASLFNNFVIGLVLGVMYLRKQSLGEVIVVHAFSNLLIVTLTPVGSVSCVNDLGNVKLLLILFSMLCLYFAVFSGNRKA